MQIHDGMEFLGMTTVHATRFERTWAMEQMEIDQMTQSLEDTINGITYVKREENEE